MTKMELLVGVHQGKNKNIKPTRMQKEKEHNNKIFTRP
jgi:hypothetical protein